MEEAKPNPTVESAPLVSSFCEITSSSKEEAFFFLESHQWDLDAAVSTFFDNNAAASASHNVAAPPPRGVPSPSQSGSPDYAPSPTHSPSRSRSPSPAPSRAAPYQLRSRRAAGEKRAAGSTRGIRTLADLNRGPSEGSDSESDDGQDYYTGGEKSGMLVRDPSKPKDADAILNQARKAGAEEASSDYARPSSRSESFTGTARLLTGETISHAPQPPEVVTHNVTFWRNGFTVDDGPLRQLDDPANAPFLQSVMNSEYPAELQPADMRTKVDLHLIKRDEVYSSSVDSYSIVSQEPKKSQAVFQGSGRTIGSGSGSGSSSSSVPSTTPLTTAPLPLRGIVVDDSSPATSIQLRLADGTRMVCRFNHHHTIQDIHGFIDASRPGGARSYQLLTMGFPPKQLSDLSQTIEQAGIANSVVIQRI